MNWRARASKRNDHANPRDSTDIPTGRFGGTVVVRPRVVPGVATEYERPFQLQRSLRHPESHAGGGKSAVIERVSFNASEGRRGKPRRPSSFLDPASHTTRDEPLGRALSGG